MRPSCILDIPQGPLTTKKLGPGSVHRDCEHCTNPNFFLVLNSLCESMNVSLFLAVDKEFLMDIPANIPINSNFYSGFLWDKQFLSNIWAMCNDTPSLQPLLKTSLGERSIINVWFFWDNEISTTSPLGDRCIHQFGGFYQELDGHYSWFVAKVAWN